MGSLNRKRSMHSNDVSAAIVMKRLLQKCMNMFELETKEHGWGCSCSKCSLFREISKEI